MNKRIPELCASGLPIGIDVCEYCGAGMDEQCRKIEYLSAVEVKENIKAAEAGSPPEHY